MIDLKSDDAEMWNQIEKAAKRVEENRKGAEKNWLVSSDLESQNAVILEATILVISRESRARVSPDLFILHMKRSETTYQCLPNTVIHYPVRLPRLRCFHSPPDGFHQTDIDRQEVGLERRLILGLQHTPPRHCLQKTTSS